MQSFTNLYIEKGEKERVEKKESGKATSILVYDSFCRLISMDIMIWS